MKKLAVTAVVALAAANSAMAATLVMRVTDTSGSQNINAAPDSDVTYQIRGQLTGTSGGDNGLALWGSDVTFGGSAVVGNNTALAAPSGDPMQAFDRNRGLTNPAPGGYGGLNDGTKLVQAGGGQDTIGNGGSVAPFPTGPVVEGVAMSGEVVLAVGTYHMPAGSSGQTHTISLASAFANVITGPASGNVYPVSAATTDVSGSTMTINSVIPGCANLTSVTVRKANPNPGVGGFCNLTDSTAPLEVTEPRTGGITTVVFGYDGATACADPTIEQATCAAPTYVAYSGAAVMNCSQVGNDKVCTFSPALENARSYQFTVGSGAGTALAKVRGLVADANGTGSVDATDRSVVVGAWSGPGSFSCGTDLDSSGLTNAIDRSSVVGAWTGPNNCAP